MIMTSSTADHETAYNVGWRRQAHGIVVGWEFVGQCEAVNASLFNR